MAGRGSATSIKGQRLQRTGLRRGISCGYFVIGSCLAGKRREAKSGFSGYALVEILVVTAIFGVLLGITIPAIQALRESSRLAACRNRVAQIAKGLANLESAIQAFPSGGWGDEWLGVPERGAQGRQPGGWIFAMLPYIEEKSLYATVEGVTSATAQDAYAKLAGSSLPGFACPSRRRSRSLPLPSTTYKTAALAPLQLATAVRSDYVGNGGSSALCPSLSTLTRLAVGSDKNTQITVCHAPPGNPANHKTIKQPLSSIISGGHSTHEGDHFGACGTCDGDVSAANPDTLVKGDEWAKNQSLTAKLARPDGGMPELQDGVFYRMSRVRVASIRDGLSNTYLVGEKYVDSNLYGAGTDKGDDRPIFVGYSDGTIRWARQPPSRDARATDNSTAFGSAHRAGWTVALADGSVRSVAFDIDPEVHKLLASRADGQLLPAW